MRRLLCAVLTLSLLGAGNDVPDMTVSRIAQSRADLAHYATSHDLHDLEAVVTDLQGTIDLDGMSAENFTATRRMLVQAWVAAIKVIEGAYDPTFDPNDRRTASRAVWRRPRPLPRVRCSYRVGFRRVGRLRVRMR